MEKCQGVFKIFFGGGVSPACCVNSGRGDCFRCSGGSILRSPPRAYEEVFEAVFVGSAGGDGGAEGGNGFLQREVGCSLVGQVGNMDKAYFDGSSRVVVKQSIEDIVADEGTGGVGHGARDVGIPDGPGHVHDGDGGKIGGGAICGYEFAAWLIACVIGNAGIPDVYGDALGSHRVPSARKSDTEDQVRLKLPGLFQYRGGSFSKAGGDLEFT